MKKLVNLGSLCIDHVYAVPNISGSGETVASSRYDVFPGGKGLNQSLAAARAGARVHHVGCVGRDGEWLIDTLAEAGVDTAGVRILDEPSGHASIQVDQNGENAIVIVGGANRRVASDDVDGALALLGDGDWLLLQNEINDVDQVLAAAHAAARRVGARVAFNLAPVDGREAGYDMSLVDLLIVNEVEVAAASGVTDPLAALERLAGVHPNCSVVMTLGAKGLEYARGDERHSVPAFSVAPVDETAAGDAFVGYLMWALLDGQDTLGALRVGSAAGALATTRAGAASSVPQRDEVLQLVAQ